MSIAKAVTTSKYFNLRLFFKIFPPFVFFGVKTRISKDYRNIYIKVSNRWYYNNNSGSMFGGAICCATDPFPAIVFQKIIKNTIAYTKSYSIEYLRPVKKYCEIKINIEEKIVDKIMDDIQTFGRATETFVYYGNDQNGKRVVKIRATAYLKQIQSR